MEIYFLKISLDKLDIVKNFRTSEKDFNDF